MIIKVIIFVIYISSVLSRHAVPRYSELDEEDQLLFKAAYDNEEYNHYQVDDEIPLNKLDLLNDGMWAMKAKMKLMKTFNKALAANLLATKLQVKEMLAEHLLSLKKHHHVLVDKKPVYDYQTPSSKPAPYHQPYYDQPAPQYNPPTPQYRPPQHTVPEYGPPQHGHDPYYGN